MYILIRKLLWSELDKWEWSVLQLVTSPFHPIFQQNIGMGGGIINRTHYQGIITPENVLQEQSNYTDPLSFLGFEKGKERSQLSHSDAVAG